MLNRIKELDMTYDLKQENKSYSYHQKGKLALSPSNKSIRFLLSKDDASEDIEDFTSVIIEKNGLYFIKSDYFQTISEEYLLEVIKGEGEIIFISDDEDEKMTIYATLK